MKRIPLLAFIVISICIGFNSCQKELVDPNGSSTTPGGTGSFRATINGTQWIATAASASRVSGLISLAGIGGGKQLVITLQDSGVHHYTLDLTSVQAAAFTDSSSGSTYAFATNQGSTTLQSGGSLDISSIGTAHKTMSGTFQFNVYRALDSMQRTITAGSFTNIAYAATTPPAATTDTFNVQIDGALFTPFTIQGIHITILSQIGVVGTDQTGAKSVTVYFPDTITPGTYTISGLGGTYSGQFNKNSTTFLLSDTGTLTILEHNTSTHRIRGNFNFHAAELLVPTDQATLSSGYFSVVYQ